MALINVREVYPRVLLGLWQTCESADQFFGNYPFLGVFREHVGKAFKSEERRREFLAVHALLHEMLGIAGDGTKKKQATAQTVTEPCMPMIGHTATGKPVLDGYHVSVTHTKGYAALMLSKTSEVACDIEYMSDRVERIKSKFMRDDEQADSLGLDQLLVCWCGKETVYKLFSDDNLQFSHMRVKPFDTMTDWACDIENIKRGVVQRVDFELTMQFVLTYTFLKQQPATAAQPKKRQDKRPQKRPKQKTQANATATQKESSWQETSPKKRQGKQQDKNKSKNVGKNKNVGKGKTAGQG